MSKKEYTIEITRYETRVLMDCIMNVIGRGERIHETMMDARINELRQKMFLFLQEVCETCGRKVTVFQSSDGIGGRHYICKNCEPKGYETYLTHKPTIISEGD